MVTGQENGDGNIDTEEHAVENGGTNSTTPETSAPASTRFTFGQWTLIVVLGTINVCAAMIYSIQAPFYPAEAESKNCTATEYGLVFGSYELTTFIACPIIGSCMYRLGPKAAYHVGLIVSGTSVILFGFLPFLEEHFAFLAASFALRITEAIGASTVFIATATIVTMQFPDSIATIFAVLELTFGTGFAVGPTVGSAFYALSGFSLPFIVLGSTLLVLGVVACFILPKNMRSNPHSTSLTTPPALTATGTATPANGSSSVVQIQSSSSINNNNSVSVTSPLGSTPAPTPTRTYAFLDLLKFSSINLYSFSNFVAAVAVGFLSATLEPQIRKFKLQKVMTGVIFFLYGGVYAIMAPFVGKLCDKISKPIYVTLVGAILSFIAFLFLGPAPFLGIHLTLWITIASLVTFGFGLAGVYVSTFLLTLQEAKRQGFPDTATTSSLVSALWMSCISLGGFVGPSAAGFLVDHFGFGNATYFVVTLESIVIMLICIHLFAKRCCGFNEVPSEFIDDEYRALLSNGRR